LFAVFGSSFFLVHEKSPASYSWIEA
jgi:hypothetical protein